MGSLIPTPPIRASTKGSDMTRTILSLAVASAALATAASAQAPGPSPRSMGMRTGLGPENFVRDGFGLLEFDANADGKLTRAEFDAGQRARFNQLDGNK